MSYAVQTVGLAAAVLTTICWIPQAWRVIRHRNTHAISLPASIALTIGQLCWLAYGLALEDWPLIGANAVSIIFTATILCMKLRFG